MKYLLLFLVFFKIGLVSFGGGMGMLPLIEEEVVKNNWMTDDMLYNFIAISEATPGPIAVNIATFIGSSQGGFLGALCATLGVIMPSFIIILFIAFFFKNFSNSKIIKAFLEGLKPVTIGLIFGMGISMVIKSVGLSFSNMKFIFNFDYKALIIIVVLSIIYLIYYLLKKKTLSPIMLIILAAAMGAGLYSF